MNNNPRVTTMSGKVLPSGPIGIAENKKKLLIVIQYYAGDMEMAEKLADLIADLQRIRSREADILIFGRKDAPNFPVGAVQRLQAKFDNVYTEKCRRDASGFPYGPNEMWYDLVSLIGQFPKWRDNYFGWLNLEADCVPTNPGWIPTLIEDYRQARDSGYLAIGHINQKPVPHMNGVAIYSTELWQETKILGGAPNIAYDIHCAKKILIGCKDTPNIYLDYQRPTITSEELFSPKKNGAVPVLYHGVKDESALAAVRAKFLTLGEKKDISAETIFTYYHAVQGIPKPEALAQIDLWKEAWVSNGFHPVVLTYYNAMKNLSYEAVATAVGKFAGQRDRNLAYFLRWVALDSMGGGFLTDYDVLPGTLKPEHILEYRKGFVPFSTDLSAAYADKASLKEMIAAVIEKTAEGEITDRDVFTSQGDETNFTKNYGEDGWQSAPLIHFSNMAVGLTSASKGKTRSMLEYLRS